MEIMEYLDIYDEQGNWLGKEKRSIVHQDALWHKTVHCWLYDKSGNVFFQVRKEEGTLYTTASGHILAGETIQEGFAREMKEELGIEIDASDAIEVNVVPFIMDRINQNGSVFRDRAFANVYLDLYEGDYQDFELDSNEVSALVLVNAKEVYEMFLKKQGEVVGKVITCQENFNDVREQVIRFSDFLVNPHETAMGKYGMILEKVISMTE